MIEQICEKHFICNQTLYAIIVVVFVVYLSDIWKQFLEGICQMMTTLIFLHAETTSY